MTLSPFTCARVQQEAPLHLGNAGLRQRYPIESAAWIWHPDASAQQVEFKLELHLEQGLQTELSLSGDQRYQFFINGERVGRGPDRCDLEHWSFARYALTLEAGRHELRAVLWHVERHAPLAQISFAPGFICHAENEADELISSGKGAWRVSKQEHISFQPITIPYYHAVGDESIVDCRALRTDDWCEPVVVRAGARFGNTGVAMPGWKLCPSSLPEQVDRLCSPGAIRAICNQWEHGQGLPAAAEQDAGIPQWNALLQGESLHIPARQECYVLWDLGEYYCAYPSIAIDGGADARIHMEWAESLYDSKRSEQGLIERSSFKGNRNDITNKIWLGFGDVIVANGKPHNIQTFWWRSGRYIRLHIKTAAEALCIEKLELNETRYPLEYQGAFESSDEQLKEVIKIAVRGMQMCSHETYMDCPYYEQLMYVGDTRLEMLCAHIMSADDRLVKRGIELFDWSRVNWGFVNERYPCHEPQHSPTFSLIWVSLLHDYAWWRDDAAWVSARLIGMRSMLEHFEPYINHAGLLDKVPGWAFTDWVPEWSTGYPPDGEFGCSGIVNLFYLMALQKASELEGQFGEEILQQRYRAKAQALIAALQKYFWDERQCVFADNLSQTEFSEHSQCLALLCDAVPAAHVDACLEALLHREDLKRCTVYFSFYLFEVLNRFSKVDALHQKYEFWKDLHHIGMCTPVEAPEPSRSDCHAWGSHPLFHLHASIAGVRPASFGFKTVRIRPQLGPLSQMSCTTAHPLGPITVSYQAGQWALELPDGLTGVFELAGREIDLSAGKQGITV